MSATVEKLATAKAIRAWRARQATRDRPAGFDDDEAAAITGVPVATLDEWYGLGLVNPSVWSHCGDGDYWRYSELDLFRAVIVVELAAAGVPLLPLALIAAALKTEYAAEDDWPQVIDGERMPDAHCATAYPLTVTKAERWLRFGNVTAILWSPACIADSWAERAEEMRAESEDVRAALEVGEAVVLDEAAIGRRLRAALDAWWVAHGR